MTIRFGIWIDHRKAILTKLEDESVSTRTIRSDVESRVRLAGGSRSKTVYGPQDFVSDSQRDRRYRSHLHRYYRNVIHELDRADAIFVFGPGEAKEELCRELERPKDMAEKVVGVETADKMTERQMVTYVKDYFQIHPRRTTS